jgi:hypothetical protein
VAGGRVPLDAAALRVVRELWQGYATGFSAEAAVAGGGIRDA